MTENISINILDRVIPMYHDLHGKEMDLDVLQTQISFADRIFDALDEVSDVPEDSVLEMYYNGEKITLPQGIKNKLLSFLSLRKRINPSLLNCADFAFYIYGFKGVFQDSGQKDSMKIGDMQRFFSSCSSKVSDWRNIQPGALVCFTNKSNMMDWHFCIALGQGLFLSKFGKHSGIYVTTGDQIIRNYAFDGNIFALD